MKTVNAVAALAFVGACATSLSLALAGDFAHALGVITSALSSAGVFVRS